MFCLLFGDHGCGVYQRNLYQLTSPRQTFISLVWTSSYRTIMEILPYYNIFVEVLLKELSKFKLDPQVISTYVSQLTPSLDENFDIPYNRCAYMYRYATGFTYFFNDCLKKFFATYSHTFDLFSKWKSYSEVKVCSLSVGPGLDYLAFMLAVLENDSGPNNLDITVVTKYGAWRNTANLILEAFSEQISRFKVTFEQLKYEQIKVIQSDLVKVYSNKIKVIAVSDAHIILMMKTLNLLAAGSTQEAPWLHALKEMLSSLKPETIIFCIDTKPSLAVITQALSQYPGKFLYGPIHQTVQIPADFPEIFGSRPVISSRGVFFVWQKKNSLTADACNSPSKNIAEENKVNNLSTFSNSSSPVVENATQVENSDADADLNLPWVKLKSFWKTSSPKTKDLLQRVMLTDERNLEEINDLVSQAEKLDINEKCSLGTDQAREQEDNKLDDSNIMLTPSQSKVQELSENNKKTAFENRYDLHSDNSGSPSPSDTLNSVSSFTCENNSSSKSAQPSDYSLPFTGETFKQFPQSSENTMDINTKENYVKLLPSVGKAIQTDALPDIPTTPSSVKALTDKIRQLAISLEGVSQHNGPSNNSGGDSFSFDQHNERSNNQTHPSDKPSCSKQSPSFGCQEPCNLSSCQNYMNDKSSCSKQSPSYGPQCLPSHQSYRNAPHQNMGCHCSCQCSRNGQMNSCLPPCCMQSIPRCSFACNHQHGRENTFPNVTSPNIVIPLQNISDNALLQIISILKSESKK